MLRYKRSAIAARDAVRLTQVPHQRDLISVIDVRENVRIEIHAAADSARDLVVIIGVLIVQRDDDRRTSALVKTATAALGARITVLDAAGRAAVGRRVDSALLVTRVCR